MHVHQTKTKILFFKEYKICEDMDLHNFGPNRKRPKAGRDGIFHTRFKMKSSEKKKSYLARDPARSVAMIEGTAELLYTAGACVNELVRGWVGW